MSLLQQLRNKRLPRNVSYLQSIKIRQEENNKRQQEEIQRKLEEQRAKDEYERARMFMIEKVKEEEKKEKENISMINENRKSVMERKEEQEVEGDNVKQNRSLTELIAGFLAVPLKQRENYIKTNAPHFKNLSTQEQQTLYRLYAKYLK